MVRARWPRSYHNSIRRWLRKNKSPQTSPSQRVRADNKYAALEGSQDDPLGGEDPDRRKKPAMTTTNDRLTDVPDLLCREQAPSGCRDRLDAYIQAANERIHLHHGVYYSTINFPGEHRIHPCLDCQHFLVKLIAPDGGDLTSELPEMLVPDPVDDDDNEGTIVIRTNGKLPYPLRIRISPA